VVTRIMLPLLNEAMHVVLEGVASAADVDRAIKLAYEFKMGPLQRLAPDDTPRSLAQERTHREDDRSADSGNGCGRRLS